MVTNQLKKSIFIGLGGVGVSSITKIKHLFLDACGDTPQVVKFLAIDTDCNSPASQNFNFKERIQLADSGDIFRYYQKLLRSGELPSWKSQENSRLFNSYPQIKHNHCLHRTDARFMLMYDKERVSRKIIETVESINGTCEGKSIVDNTIYVHLIFSTLGFTGSGICIDMAKLVKSAQPNAKVIGHAICCDLSNISHHSMSPMEVKRLKSNSHEAIEELNCEIKASMDSEVKSFDQIIFYDNKESVGTDLSGILTDLIDKASQSIFSGL
ncbi:MAG: tubulin-like doman-containing protein [Rikenellaceae bacterium]